ncbi:DUF4381 domain-containing protein [Paraglaciecola aestuariivivens]
MMNPLQDLKDIHLPAPIESWPPAYGWWLLALVVLVTIGLLTYCIVRGIKTRQAKREALAELQNYDLSDPKAISHFNKLLKRAARVYFPEFGIENLHTEQWLAFLTACISPKHQAKLQPDLAAMQGALYKKQSVTAQQLKDYQRACQAWLKHALPPSKGVLHKLEQQDV